MSGSQYIYMYVRDIIFTKISLYLFNFFFLLSYTSSTHRQSCANLLYQNTYLRKLDAKIYKYQKDA